MNTFYIPNDGYVKNPLWQAFGRNDQCPCGSGKKWKRCCEPDTPLYVKQEFVGAYKEALEKAKRGEIPAW